MQYPYIQSIYLPVQNDIENLRRGSMFHRFIHMFHDELACAVWKFLYDYQNHPTQIYDRKLVSYEILLSSEQIKLIITFTIENEMFMLERYPLVNLNK